MQIVQNIKNIGPFIFILTILLISPAMADVVNITDVTVADRIYYLENYAVPIEMWLLFIIIGFVFLIFGVLSDIAAIPFSTLSFMCFIATAYMTPMVGFIGYETIIDGTTLNIIPYIQFTLQPWSMMLLYGMAIIAFINIWRGVLWNFGNIKHRKMEDL